MRFFSLTSRSRLACGTALLAALASGPVAAPAAAASVSTTENLIQLLVKNKIITRAAGADLLKQAEAEAAQARAELASARAGSAAATAAAPAAAETAGGTPAGVATASRDLPAPAAGTIRVPYIPEAMRAQITEQIKKDVLAQAESQGWASAKQVPDWLKGVKLYGDVRFRSESIFYSRGNAAELIDFQAFNTISPIDINGNTNPTGFPVLNTRTDRANRLRLRARLGVEAKLSDFATITAQLATGDDNSPISTNQLLGGGFAKKNIWLDQAYLKLTPAPWLAASFGRFPNPFNYTELLFDRDINFDGVAVTADADRFLPEGGRVQLTVGAFPLGYAANNFPTTSLDKTGDTSKWLFSAQVQGGASFDGGIDINASAAYHYFKSVQGQLSTSCALYNGNRQCSTDQYQPIFLRKGNTLFFLRDIAADPASPNNFAQPQLLGQAFGYGVLDVIGTVKVPVRDGIDVVIEANYLRNLSYKASDICRFNPKGLPINNITVANPVDGAVAGTAAAAFYSNPCRAETGIVNDKPYSRIARFDGGNQGYSIRGIIGTAKPKKAGQWNVEASYRYLESDATLDSFADSDFHFGGTNAKGYIIGGTISVYNGVNFSGRWLSANQISGPPLAIDVLQFDLTAAF